MTKKRPPKAKTRAQPRPDAVLLPQPQGGALMAPGQGQGGRPKEVLRRKCREAIEGGPDAEHGVTFVARVMRGTETEDVTVTTGSGANATTQVVQVRPKLRDRLYAAELLLDRGYGKPDQALQIEDERPRRTGEEVMARIMELLPRVIAVLPVERKEIARLMAQRRQVELLVQGKEVRP